MGRTPAAINVTLINLQQLSTIKIQSVKERQTANYIWQELFLVLTTRQQCLGEHV